MFFLQQQISTVQFDGAGLRFRVRVFGSVYHKSLPNVTETLAQVFPYP